VLIRQAHPGPRVRAYHRFEEKLRDARRHQQEDALPWPVLTDDLDGTVHQVYGGLADPTYLIDADGRVAFYNMWTSASVLHGAIDALLARGGRGVVQGGWDRPPHLAASLTDGWRGLRRGLPQSYFDMVTAAPTVAETTWLGYQFRPLLAPITLRARSLPAAAKLALLAGAGLALAATARGLSRTDGRAGAPSP
jgi:hypothetical protein